MLSIKNKTIKALAPLLAATLLALVNGCATTTTETAITPQTTKAATTSRSYTGERLKVALGEFANKTNFMNSVFSSSDTLGRQAQTILKKHLQSTGRFSVLDRNNIQHLEREARYSKTQQAIKGASYIITGDIVEFGKRQLGDKQFFGVLGKGVNHIAYAKVSILLVNTHTSEIIYSAHGAGEVKLSHREVIGFGGTAGYDSTLHGKVLDLAIREAVDDLVRNVD